MPNNMGVYKKDRMSMDASDLTPGGKANYRLGNKRLSN